MSRSSKGAARVLIPIAAMSALAVSVLEPFKKGGWIDRSVLHDGSAASSWEEMYKIGVKRTPVWERTESEDRTVSAELNYRLPTSYYSFRQQNPTFDQRNALFGVTSDYTVKVEARTTDLLKASGVTRCPKPRTIENYPRLISEFDDPEPAPIKRELDSNNQLIGRLFAALDAQEKVMQCIVLQDSNDERYEGLGFRRPGRTTILRNTGLLEQAGADAHKDASDYQTAVRKLGITLRIDSFSGRKPALPQLTSGN